MAKSQTFSNGMYLSGFLDRYRNQDGLAVRSDHVKIMRREQTCNGLPSRPVRKVKADITAVIRVLGALLSRLQYMRLEQAYKEWKDSIA